VYVKITASCKGGTFFETQCICYTFVAIDDVIVTSVNTYTSMMGISTEDKYLIKSWPAN